MHRLLPSGLSDKIFLGIALIAAAFALAGSAAAQTQTPEPFKVLQLSSRASVYDVVPFLRMVPADPKKEYDGFSEALNQFKSGLGKNATEDAAQSPLFFKNQADDGLWLFFSVLNRTQAKTRWTLDLGNLFSGTTGLPDVFALYTSQNAAPLIIDGRDIKNKQHAKGQDKNAVPLTLEPGQQTVVAIYLDTVPGSVASLSLSLREFVATKSATESKSSQFVVLQLGIALLLLIYAISWNSHRKNFAPMVLIVYLLGNAMAFSTSDEIISFGTNFTLENITTIYIANTIAALILAKYVYLSGNGSKILKAACVFAIIALIAMIFLRQVVGHDLTSLDVFALRVLPPAACAGIIALGTYVTFYKNRPQALSFTLGWMILFLGLLGTEATRLGFAGFSMIGINLYWIAFAAHISLVSFATLRFISISEENARKEIARRKRKAEEETELRKTKEQADQTRMLSIMQREKELMADLRNREAERIQALRHAKEVADKANKAKSDFLAVISHEIRTPMTGVMGMIRLLIDTPLNERQQEYVRTIQYSGEALLTLLNDILDLSKAEEGKMSIETLDFDLKKLVDSVVLLMSGRAEEKKLLLKSEIASGTPPFLKGDPTRLRQILLNLVSNAIKFTQSGTVTVTVKVNDNNGKKPRIYFAVTDTGMGISDDVQKKLFTPYAQADSSISRNFGGTGLGLAICKRLVDAMGGNIQLQSTLGKGTTFYFIIPMDVGAEERHAAPAPKADNAILRVLVVDDNAINQKVVAGLLEKEGHRIVTCGSAEAAMQEIDRSPFDVILMDMEMPQIDGVTATKMIRALPDLEKSRIKIIAMTANTRREDIQRCKDAGMNDHISKPINPEGLRATLVQIAKQINPSTAGGVHSGKPAPQQPVAAAVPQPAAADPAPANGDARKYFNADMIGSLKASLGPAQMDDMMLSLYQKTEELIASLEKAITENDIVSIAARGHDIKGMTANFGLTALSDIAGRLERQAKEKSPIKTLAEISAQIRPAYDATRSHVEAFLKS